VFQTNELALQTDRGADDGAAIDPRVAAMTADEPDGQLTTWTLAAIKARNMALEGYCETQGCGQFYVFNLDALIEKFGEVYRVPEYLPVDCMECGGRVKFKLAMVPPVE
jgi:hypothetical protein